MSRLGFMGGTFNPVHIGHLMMAEQAFNQYNLDTVFFMPNRYPAYKEIEGNVSDEDRVNMINLSIRGNEHFKLLDMELKRQGTTYSYDTFLDLKKIYPEDELFFIIGGDSLYSLEKWYEYEKLFGLTSFLVAPRFYENVENEIEAEQKEIDRLTNRYKVDIKLLCSPIVQVSSSDIRERAANEDSIRYMVHNDVYEYIMSKHLYSK